MLDDVGELQLVRPTSALESAYRDMIAEFKAGGAVDRGYAVNEVPERFSDLVTRLANMEKGVGLRPGFVPQTTFWLVRDGSRVLGEIRLRHRLTPELEHRGGHIGYAVRPSERNKGYCTRMLAMCLEEARKLGLARVLLTCDPQNAASAKVMIKNGGVKTTDGINPDTGLPMSRYWIEL